MRSPLLMLLVAVVSPFAAGAQVVGTVNPRAVGPPVQQPAPIGGIRTTPLGAAVPTPDRARNASRRPGWRGVVPLRGIVPLQVTDAALLRGSAVVVTSDMYAGSRWFPSAAPPTWQLDSLAPRVDAWRDIIVQDVICTDTGVCIERSTRMRARWSALCNCYRFADALQRIWRVE